MKPAAPVTRVHRFAASLATSIQLSAFSFFMKPAAPVTRIRRLDEKAIFHSPGNRPGLSRCVVESLNRDITIPNYSTTQLCTASSFLLNNSTTQLRTALAHSTLHRSCPTQLNTYPAFLLWRYFTYPFNIRTTRKISARSASNSSLSRTASSSNTVR